MTAISEEVVSAVRALPRSEDEVLRRLYEEHRARINSYCMRELGSREDADDATQLTFLNAFRGLARGAVPVYESAWLFTIARNVCLNIRRSAFRRLKVEMPSDLEGVEGIHPATADGTADLLALTGILIALPQLQRDAILRREWQGMSYREIAADLGTSQAAVETAIFRARRAIVQGLEEPRQEPAEHAHTGSGRAVPHPDDGTASWNRREARRGARHRRRAHGSRHQPEPPQAASE